MTGVLPPVHPHLARWAADCGAGILGPMIGAVDGVATQQVRSVLSAATLHSELARSSAPSIRGWADSLAVAWSARQPARYLRSLADAVGRLAAEIVLTVGRVGTALDAIENAQRSLAGAIQRAHAAVDWSPGYVPWGTPEAEARTAAARMLAAAADSSRQQLIAAMSSISGALSTDPGASLTAITPPTVSSIRGSAHPSVDFRPTELSGAATRIDRLARAQLAADLHRGTPWRRTFALRTLAALRAAEASGGDGRAQLLVYQPDAFGGQGRVAVSVGDVSRADHVAILTPGIANSPADLDASVPTAAGLRDAAQQTAPGERTAVVLWFGYDIPVSGSPNHTSLVRELADLTAAASADPATEGAPLLVADTAAIRTTMRDSATLTLIGHSMGSVVTARAAHEPIGADSVVLLGSPGVGRPDARAQDLAGVAPENVFVLSSDRDPVTRSFTDLGGWLATGLVAGPGGAGRPSFGTDPASTGFGAQRISAPPPPLWNPGGGWRYSFAEHSLGRYLGGAGLVAVGAVVAGRTARVPRTRGR